MLRSREEASGSSIPDPFGPVAYNHHGCVIGINFGEGFLNPKDAEMWKAMVNAISFQVPDLVGKALDDYAAEEFKRDLMPAKGTAATIDDAVAHIDHAVKVAGIEHVGIGSDFDGISGPPKGLEDISKMTYLSAALLKKGYSDDDVKKIMGGNTLRVIRQVVGR